MRLATAASVLAIVSFLAVFGYLLAAKVEHPDRLHVASNAPTPTAAPTPISTGTKTPVTQVPVSQVPVTDSD